jgi:serine/threonine protein kinase
MQYDLHPQYQNKKEFLLHINRYFNIQGHAIHKARNEIKVIDDFVIKSFKIPHFINKIAYTFFRSSKAKKSFYNSLKISDFTPTPVGYIEYKRFGLIHQSYYISENFTNDFTMRAPLTDTSFEDRERIFKEFAHFTYLLHEDGIKHLDYSPGNILVQKKEDGYLFKVVDVNRMAFKMLSPKERLENFSKLWAKDEDLNTIIEAYSAYLTMPKEEAKDIALTASQKHKNKKNLKKRLKGIEVVD